MGRILYKYVFVYLRSGVRLRISTSGMLLRGRILYPCNCSYCTTEPCVLDIMFRATFVFQSLLFWILVKLFYNFTITLG